MVVDAAGYPLSTQWWKRPTYDTDILENAPPSAGVTCRPGLSPARPNTSAKWRARCPGERVRAVHGGIPPLPRPARGSRIAPAGSQGRDPTRPCSPPDGQPQAARGRDERRSGGRRPHNSSRWIAPTPPSAA